MKKKEIAAALLGIACALVLWITVFSRGTVSDPLLFKPFHNLKTIGKEIVELGLRGNIFGNILLFIPIGILFPIAFNSKLNCTFLFGFCLSLTIELFQLIFHRGYFEIDDLITNTFGALLGYCIVLLVRRIKMTT